MKSPFSTAWSSALRTAAKSMLAGGLHYSGLLAAWPRIRAPRLHVLGYHRVVPDFAAVDGLPQLCVSRETFTAQLEYVVRHMEVFDLATAALVLRGARPLRRDACLVTFDDGYREVYTQAFPILRRLGLPAAVFLSTGFVSARKRFPHDRLYDLLSQTFPELPVSRVVAIAARRLPSSRISALVDALASASGEEEPCLTWEQCAEMARHGIDFGSHTVSHTPLAREPRARMRRELRDSIEEIEQRLACRARFVAYPNGIYSDEVIRACEELDVQAAFTTEDRPNRPGQTHALCVGRRQLWEAHARGWFRQPSPARVAHSLANLGLGAVSGRVPQHAGTAEEGIHVG
jgi:peptidoglycan/xylan/chitin deacetylase (PgdA/CDA1 family)